MSTELFINTVRKVNQRWQILATSKLLSLSDQRPHRPRAFSPSDTKKEKGRGEDVRALQLSPPGSVLGGLSVFNPELLAPSVKFGQSGSFARPNLSRAAVLRRPISLFSHRYLLLKY
jgi:hypothetical protein